MKDRNYIRLESSKRILVSFATIFLLAIWGSPSSAERSLDYLNLLLMQSCRPDCESKSCGEDDGCGGACIIQTCGDENHCGRSGTCVEGAVWDQVTERFGGSNATLDHPDVMVMAWFAENPGPGNRESKILYHDPDSKRRHIVHVDLRAIPKGTEIIDAKYVMALDTEDTWELPNDSYQKGLSLYMITDPSGTGMWNITSIGTALKDGLRNLRWTDDGGTFSDCVSPVPIDTVYSIGRGTKQFYSFNVTNLVQTWIDSPWSNMGFTFDDHVPSDNFDNVNLRPYLEITYYKKNLERPSQPSNFRVFHRAGQTFITWREHPYDGQFFDMKYRIYRSTSPISKNTLDEAELIAEVNQNSSLNLARTEARQKLDPTYSTLHNYIIAEGNPELRDDDGLFVYTSKKGQRVYYAVTSVEQGNENRIDFTNDNSLTLPITEKVDFPTPVRQSSFFTSGGDLIQEMAHWADDTMSYKVGHGFNFMVNLSSEYISSPSVPTFLDVSLGGRGTRYFDASILENGITIKPDCYMPPTANMPFDGYDNDNLQTWWSGASSTYKTQQKLSDGVFVPYTENRILYYINFAKKKYTIDTNRVYLRGFSMGGTGAISLGLKHPEVFASITATVGSPNWRLNIGMVNSHYEVTNEGWRNNANLLWGTQTENLRHQNSTPIWDWMNAGWYLLHNIGRETPFLEMNNGKRDQSVRHFPLPQFYKDIKKSKHGFAANFYDGGHSDSGTVLTPRFATIVKNESYPALSNVSIDDNPGGIHPETGMAKIETFSPLVFEGDPAGTINGYYDIEWSRQRKQFSSSSKRDDMVDQVDHYELALRLEESATVSQATADITPRRLQNFRITPGKNYFWINRSLTSNRAVQSGTVSADSYGLVTIPGFIIEKQTLGNKLIIAPQ